MNACRSLSRIRRARGPTTTEGRRPERMSEIQGTLDRMCDEVVAPEDQLDKMEW